MHISKDAFAAAFAEAVKAKQPLFLTPKGKSFSFLCTPIGIIEDSIVFRNSIPIDILPEVVTSTEFTLACRDYQVVSAALFAHGTDIRFPTHHISLLPQSRTEERVVFSAEDNAEVAIYHPFDKGTILKRRLYDLSKGGLSFRAHFQTNLIQPGRILAKMKITTPFRTEETLSGRVIYVKKIYEENKKSYSQVGVQFINSP